MTEGEWLACTDPQPMRAFLQGRASDRKLRLFAVACCRRVWDLLNDERSRKAVETAERHADGLATAKELRFVRTCAAEAWDYSTIAPPTWPPPRFAHKACAHCACPSGGAFESEIGSAAHYARRHHWMMEGPERTAAEASDDSAQATLLREVFGNPFRPAPLQPSWFTPAAVTLARTIYDGRTFDRLPELAGALDRAGCTDADVLAHCRGPGPHVRGCWVVDLILGKS